MLPVFNWELVLELATLATMATFIPASATKRNDRRRIVCGLSSGIAYNAPAIAPAALFLEFTPPEQVCANSRHAPSWRALLRCSGGWVSSIVSPFCEHYSKIPATCAAISARDSRRAHLCNSPDTIPNSVVPSCLKLRRFTKWLRYHFAFASQNTSTINDITTRRFLVGALPQTPNVG